MENYNLTAELKKIASGITTSDPNTELGNINSGVGNLDTAMQGVATAIGNISIPNPGTNIDGVATAITNKNIPDPSSNITAVATAVDNLAGGKDLGDIETILTTMNGNIANLGSNHITNIVANPSGYLMYKGDGTVTPLPNKAEYTTYTDTNNIGATDVQGAIDKLSGYSEGYGTINSTYLNGRVSWNKIGRVVSVYCDFTTIANLPNTDYVVKLISGLPPILCANNWIKKWTLPATDNAKRPIILGSSGNPGFVDTSIYSSGNGSVTSGTTYLTSFTYISK